MIAIETLECAQPPVVNIYTGTREEIESNLRDLIADEGQQAFSRVNRAEANEWWGDDPDMAEEYAAAMAAIEAHGEPVIEKRGKDGETTFLPGNASIIDHWSDLSETYIETFDTLEEAKVKYEGQSHFGLKIYCALCDLAESE